MKYRVVMVVFIGLYGITRLIAKDKEDTAYVGIPTIPNQVPDQYGIGTVSKGCGALQDELQTLDARIRNTPVMLQGPLNKLYNKYLSRLQTQYLDKQSEKHSSLYKASADKLHILNESSYITILARMYPKTFASVMTSGGIIALAGIVCGVYMLVKEYAKQEKQSGEQSPSGAPEIQGPPIMVVDAGNKA